MTDAPVHERARIPSGWLAHILAAGALAAIIVLAWPGGEVVAVPAAQERGVVELAALLGVAAEGTKDIEENLRSWPRFPSSEDEVRELATALAACPMVSLPESERIDLARRLYAITNGADVSDAELSSTIQAFLREAEAARCPAPAALTLVEIVRRIARTDPRPRPDWW